MPSLKLDKFMARLYARAGNATVTLNRNDLEVLNNLIQSEVTRYETEIERLASYRVTYGTISPAGSTEASSQASSAPTQTTATGSSSPQGGFGGVGYTPPEK